MKTAEFLELILPQQGYYCFTREYTNNSYFASRVAALEYSPQGNSFFCPFSFENPKRAQAYAMQTRAFWIDIDCGEGKPYATQQDALVAFHNAAMPIPTVVVNSGNGIHIYWVMDDSIPFGDWQPLAMKLKARCQEVGLAIDAAVTADAARIMRLPGSENTKPNKPITSCLVISNGPTYELKNFALLFADIQTQSAIIRVGTPRSKQNLTSYVSGIWDKDYIASKCQFFKDALETGGREHTYNEWLAALTIAKLVGAEQEVSCGHTGYNSEEVKKKCQSLLTTHSCKSIMSVSSKCNGCNKFYASPRAIIQSTNQLGVVQMSNEKLATLITGDVFRAIGNVVTEKVHPSPKMPSLRFVCEEDGDDMCPICSRLLDQDIVVDNKRVFALSRVAVLLNGKPCVIRIPASLVTLLAHPDAKDADIEVTVIEQRGFKTYLGDIIRNAQKVTYIGEVPDANIIGAEQRIKTNLINRLF